MQTQILYASDWSKVNSESTNYIYETRSEKSFIILDPVLVIADTKRVKHYLPKKKDNAKPM